MPVWTGTTKAVFGESGIGLDQFLHGGESGSGLVSQDLVGREAKLGANSKRYPSGSNSMVRTQGLIQNPWGFYWRLRDSCSLEVIYLVVLMGGGVKRMHNFTVLFMDFFAVNFDF